MTRFAVLAIAIALGCDYQPSDDEKLCWSLGPRFHWQITSVDTVVGFWVISTGKVTTVIPHTDHYDRYGCVNTRPGGLHR